MKIDPSHKWSITIGGKSHDVHGTRLVIFDPYLRDIGDLRDLALTKLSISGAPVKSLAPLRGMPLRDLDIRSTKVCDLSPLRGAPLEILDISYTEVHDLSPLRGAPLKVLLIHETPASRKRLPEWLDRNLVVGHIGDQVEETSEPESRSYSQAVAGLCSDGQTSHDLSVYDLIMKHPKGTLHGPSNDPSSPGRKDDTGKSRYGLIDPGFLRGLADVLTFGAKKYSESNWKMVKHGRSRYADALYRHLEAWRSGEKIDKESGLSHLGHAACCLMFLTYLESRE